MCIVRASTIYLGTVRTERPVRPRINALHGPSVCTLYPPQVQVNASTENSVQRTGCEQSSCRVMDSSISIEKDNTECQAISLLFETIEENAVKLGHAVAIFTIEFAN